MQPTAGFGSPSKYGIMGSYWDLGFGDKVPAGGTDAKGWPSGFGDKSSGGSIILMINPNLTGGQMPDCGGDVIKLIAPWKVVGGDGPYRVQLRDAHTNALWPQDAFGCWSGRFGEGTSCTPNKSYKELPWSMPPLPPGRYDIVVSWGPGWAQQAEINDVLTVIWRDRSRISWSLRGHFPPRFATGPRAPTAEKLLG